MDPAALLSVLPKCPPEWQLRRSEARTLAAPHPETHAIRVYEEFVPPERQADMRAETVTMTIRDTGRRGPQVEAFRAENLPKSSTPGGGAGDLRNLGHWGAFPLVFVKLAGGRNALRVLVNGRFVIELTFFGNNLGPAPAWFNACNLERLLNAPETPAETDRRVAEQTFLDELHPEKNRRYLRPAAAAESK